MKSEKVHWDAEELFVRRQKTLDQISSILGVSRSALVSWCVEGRWIERRRERMRESPQAAVEVLKRQRELLIREIGGEHLAAPEALEALQKLTFIIGKMETPLEAIGPMLDLFGRFAQFVGAHAPPEACEVVREWTEKFLDEERKKCG